MAASFSVGAVGTPPLSYQWTFNGTNIPGATEPSLTVTNAKALDAGDYSVVVTNVAGSTNSTTARLTLAQVIGWGADTFGQTVVPLDLTNAMQVAGGWHHSVALRTDGTVTAWGDNASGQTNVSVGLSNVVAISSKSGDHILALTRLLQLRGQSARKLVENGRFSWVRGNRS